MKLKEIEEKAVACIKAAGDRRYAYSSSHLTKDAEGTFVLRLIQEYEFVELQFDDLMRLSELFQTRAINIGDRYSTGGCETCDHGSRYQLSIYILKSPLTVDKD